MIKQTVREKDIFEEKCSAGGLEGSSMVSRGYRWDVRFFLLLRVRMIRWDVMTSHDRLRVAWTQFFSKVSHSRLGFYPVIRININILWFVHVMGNGELHLGAN
jgi:hypothetical protein